MTAGCLPHPTVPAHWRPARRSRRPRCLRYYPTSSSRAAPHSSSSTVQLRCASTKSSAGWRVSPGGDEVPEAGTSLIGLLPHVDERDGATRQHGGRQHAVPVLGRDQRDELGIVAQGFTLHADGAGLSVASQYRRFCLSARLCHAGVGCSLSLCNHDLRLDALLLEFLCTALNFYLGHHPGLDRLLVCRTEGDVLYLHRFDDDDVLIDDGDDGVRHLLVKRAAHLDGLDRVEAP